jgi:hypothetical protein
VKEKDGCFEGGVGCFLRESFVVMVNVLEEELGVQLEKNNS